MHVPERVIRPHTTWVASADIPTRFGPFTTHVFESFDDAGERKEHVALVHGDVRGATALPVRVHSECMTSEVFGSLKCDCREQLEAAMKLIGKRGAGMILYLRQEGRGIGLANKIRAYELQQRGLDTVDANLALGFGADERSYEPAATMLRTLGVRSIALMTNNPDKIAQLEQAGIAITRRVPHALAPGAHNRAYLETKRARSGHMLDDVLGG